MEEENSFAVIKQDVPKAVPTRGFLYWLRKIGIIRRPMIIIHEDRTLITETEKEAIVVLDINGTEVASAELKDGVLKITPKIKNVSKLICNLKDFDEKSNIIKTTKGATLESKGGRNQTTISQLAIAKANCHPL